MHDASMYAGSEAALEPTGLLAPSTRREGGGTGGGGPDGSNHENAQTERHGHGSLAGLLP
jgi:hypothetical protein